MRRRRRRRRTAAGAQLGGCLLITPAPPTSLHQHKTPSTTTARDLYRAAAPRQRRRRSRRSGNGAAAAPLCVWGACVAVQGSLKQHTTIQHKQTTNARAAEEQRQTMLRAVLMPEARERRECYCVVWWLVASCAALFACLCAFLGLHSKTPPPNHNKKKCRASRSSSRAARAASRT